jgi:hypothetical protein
MQTGGHFESILPENKALDPELYRGYLPDDRCLLPLTVLLSTTLALWQLVYLVAGMAAAYEGEGARHIVACDQCALTIEEVASLVVYATQALVTTGSALRGGGIEKPIVQHTADCAAVRTGRLLVSYAEIDSGLHPLMAWPY